MGILKPVLILAILSSTMLCTNAWATERPPKVGEYRDPPRAEAKPAPDAQAAPKAVAQAPKKTVLKRRAVRQNLDALPPPRPPVAYGPRLVPSAPVGVRPLPSPVAPAPQILNGCNGGACTDANGERYNGGVGTTLLSPQGRLCSNNGITVQCF